MILTPVPISGTTLTYLSTNRKKIRIGIALLAEKASKTFALEDL